MDKSEYYVTYKGSLCITVKSCWYPPRVCEVIGCINDTWFLHIDI